MSGGFASIFIRRRLRMLKGIFGVGEKVSFGKSSFACALIACALFLVVSHANRMGVLFGGNILRALNQLGMVQKERSDVAELKPSSLFALNDANAVLWFTWLAFILAGLSIALALYANHKRESTLYASAGFILATLGIGLIYPWVMVTVQAAGAIALIAIRKQYALPGRPASEDENAAPGMPPILDAPPSKQ